MKVSDMWECPVCDCMSELQEPDDFCPFCDDEKLADREDSGD